MSISPGPVGEFVVRMSWEIALRLDNNEGIAQHETYTNCWFLAFDTPTKVEENGVAYTSRATATLCDNNPSSYYYDSANKTLYIHTSGSDDPSGYLILGFFNFYASTHSPLVIDGIWHEPRLGLSSIPDVTLATSLYHEGGTQQSFGTIKLNNSDGFFDTRLATYIHEAKYIKVEAARLGVNGTIESLTASDFSPVWDGWSGDIKWNDNEIEVSTEDLRRVLA